MSTPRAPAPSQPGEDGDRSSDAVTVRRVEFPVLSDTARDDAPLPPDILGDVEVTVSAVLGAARMTVLDVLSLRPGSIIRLDSLAGQSVDMRVNNVTIAGGEVIVIDDQYAVRVNNIRSHRRSPILGRRQESRQPPESEEEPRDESVDG